MGLLLLVAAAILGQPTAADSAKAVPTETDKVRILETLHEVIEDDQRYRVAISWGTTDEEEIARLEALDDEEHIAEYSRRNREGIRLDPDTEKDFWAKQTELDMRNTRILINLVERFGWPNEQMLGPDTPDPTPVLIHMSQDDADWVLPILRVEVLARRMEPGPYATIFDRKRQHEGVPQLYGTCLAFDSSTRTILPPAIVSIDETNAARAAIWMEPLAEYRETDARTAAGG